MGPEGVRAGGAEKNPPSTNDPSNVPEHGCLCPRPHPDFHKPSNKGVSRATGQAQPPSANPSTLFPGALTSEHLPLP